MGLRKSREMRGRYANGTAVVSFLLVDAYVIQPLFRSFRRGSCFMG